MSVTPNFAHCYLAGMALLVSYSGLSKIVVKFTPTPTYYLLLILSSGLICYTGLFAALNTIPWPQHSKYEHLLWSYAAFATDLPLIFIYYIRTSCLFTLNREKELALKIVTGIFVGIVGGANFTNLVQILHNYVVPLNNWAWFGAVTLPMLDVSIPLYLFFSESIFIIKFFNSIVGDKEMKKTYKLVLFANTIVIDVNDRLCLFWLASESLFKQSVTRMVILRFWLLSNSRVWYFSW
jgi:hypothetical protein